MRGQIKLAEERIIRTKAAVPKPAQRTVYRDLAKARLKLKKNYLESKENGESDAIKDFLASMGHNLVSSTMSGRTNDYEESRGPGLVDDSDDHDISNWMAEDNESVLEELENPDTYQHRKIGKKEVKAWKNKKCSSCKVGFNSKSDPIRCDGCDSYTHKRQACIQEGSKKSQFYCKLCISTDSIVRIPEKPSTNSALVSKTEKGYKCDLCGIAAKTKFSVKRHVERHHPKKSAENSTENVLMNETEIEQVISESDQVKDISRENMDQVQAEVDGSEHHSLHDVLASVGLESYETMFEKEILFGK